jgi:hypothetical protein
MYLVFEALSLKIAVLSKNNKNQQKKTLASKGAISF